MVKTMEAKVKTIIEMPALVDISGIRSFMGLAGYYRKFGADFSSIAKPLNDLTQTNTPFVRSEARQQAFDELKGALTSSPVLRSPDFKRLFE